MLVKIIITVSVVITTIVGFIIVFLYNYRMLPDQTNESIINKNGVTILLIGLVISDICMLLYLWMFMEF